MTKNSPSATIRTNKNMKKISAKHRKICPTRRRSCPTAELAPQRSLPHSASGFSLIELMFAVVFLTIIVFGVIKLQTSNLVMSNAQNNAIQASFLANQGVEIVKAIGYSEFCSSGDTCYKQISNPTGDTYVLADVTSENDMESISDTPFERIIKFDKTDLTLAYKATSIVEWADNAGEHRRDVDGIPPLENGHAEANLIIFN